MRSKSLLVVAVGAGNREVHPVARSGKVAGGGRSRSGNRHSISGGGIRRTPGGGGRDDDARNGRAAAPASLAGDGAPVAGVGREDAVVARDVKRPGTGQRLAARRSLLTLESARNT
jgi:hypothetical protein